MFQCSPDDMCNKCDLSGFHGDSFHKGIYYTIWFVCPEKMSEEYYTQQDNLNGRQHESDVVKAMHQSLNWFDLELLMKPQAYCSQKSIMKKWHLQKHTIRLVIR